MFYKDRTRSPRGCFECGDTTHFIASCPKRTKLDSSNKYDYTNQNNYSKGDNKKKNRFGNNKKKKFQKIMSQACAALSNFDFSSDNSSSSKEDEKVKHKQGDFTGLCLMGKSSRNKNLNLKLERSFSKISSLRSVHDDMSAKPYENCKMIMVNYADLWLVHTQVAS
jgi:hypothetical protein